MNFHSLIPGVLLSALAHSAAGEPVYPQPLTPEHNPWAEKGIASNFGPDLKNAEWNLFSFDLPETQKYDISPWRYRPVTYPKGMENWFAKDFDPAQADWKKGQFPIGQYKGKLTDKDTRNPWNEIPRTLWEKEVLLVRGTFEFPALKPGYEYRLRVQRGQGVGAGDGFKVFINGKPLVESKEGLGRRAGDTIRGGWITKEVRKEFGKGPVTFAATAFLRYGDRAIVQMLPVPQGIFSMWLEERLTPPLDTEVMHKATRFVPMFTSEWQALQDPESDEAASDDGIFRNDGTTDSLDHFWSGDVLMDLNQLNALKITQKNLGGTDYFFIEAGGFRPKNPVGWKSPLIVMKRG